MHEVTEKRPRGHKAAFFLSLTTPPPTAPMQQSGLPWEHLRLHPLLQVTGGPRGTMAQMKEQTKAPEKMQLSDGGIANLSDAQF